jgi:hydrogenase expression/formation protein HypE
MKKLGKIDRDLLERFVFRRLGYRRRDVIVPPRFGEDAGVIRAGGRLLVLAMDPITGASELAGWLSVHVNANDVAVMGAEPRWFSATILLPENDLEDLDRITRDIHRACRSLHVAVITGHTEVSPGISRPIIVGQMVGELVSRKPITSSGARPGDLLVMSKTAGIEGTAILASDFRGMLAGRVPDEVLTRAERFYRKISVVKEALRLTRGGFASAMHDPTEGGLIGGAYELAEASGCSFIIYEKAVPVAKETRIICEVLGCDPLKLISSGVLLAAVPRRFAGRLSRIGGFRVIGELRGRREGNIVVRNDGSEERVGGPVLDELWRLLMEYS